MSENIFISFSHAEEMIRVLRDAEHRLEIAAKHVNNASSSVQYYMGILEGYVSASMREDRS